MSVTAGGTMAAEGTLATFLLTDIEGSTRLWEEHARAMGAALATHDHLLRTAVEAAGGTVIKTTGDGLLAVFADAAVAVLSTVAAQRGLRDASWGETGPLRVRMSLHSGVAEARDGDYFGPALNRTARILSTGHGGQILLSAVTAALVRDRLPRDVELDDLGSHRLRDLDRPEQIFQLCVGDLPQAFPALRSLSTRRSNLPIQLTSFVGREEELADVVSLASRARLVTLIGTGGTGKTRLMLEAAGRLEGRFADGVWLAELAPLSDPAQIGPELVRALGIPDLPGRPAQEIVAEYLGSKETLLLLDNAEHLIDGVADVAGRLLAVAPGLRILTTSREALAVPGEAVVQVPSLSCPRAAGPSGLGGSAAQEGPATSEELADAMATEAVRLFAERASSVLPGFEVTVENVAAVSEICRRLDGIPLAIELAAARVSAMSPAEIARRLGDRFRLLAGGRRTAVPRQQTLHALIDWSWGLLTDDDRRLLRRLAVFAGGWSAESAAAVVPDPAAGGRTQTPDDIVDGLTRLVDRSLVIVERGALTRYRMLETIRQYAREQLIESGEAPATADRHLAHFLELAEQALPGLRGPAMVDWLDRLDAELENEVAALEWALEGHPEAAVRLAIPALGYWRFRPISPDNEERIAAAVELARQLVRPPATPTMEQRSIACHLMGEAAWIWSMRGRGASVTDWGDEALAICREAESTGGISPAARVVARIGHGLAGLFAGRPVDELRADFEELLRVVRDVDDPWTLAVAAGSGASGMIPLDHVTANELLQLGTEAAARIRNPYAIAIVSLASAGRLGRAGRFDEAEPLFAEAAARFGEIGDVRFALVSRSDQGHLLRRIGRPEDALAIYRETIGGWVRFGNRGAVANQLENIAFAWVAQGRLVPAARLLGAAEALREQVRAPMAATEVPEHRDWVDRLRAEGGGARAAEIDAAWQAGRRLEMAAAVAEAVAAPVSWPVEG